MKSFDLDKPVTDTTGKVIEQDNQVVKISSLLISILSNGSSDNYLKYIPWALQLQKDGTLQVDEVDRDHILNLLLLNRTLSDLVKYQIHKALLT